LKTPSKHFFAEINSVDFFNSSWTPNGKTAYAMKTRIEDEFIHSLIEDWLKKGSNIIFWEIFQNRAAPGRNYLFSSFIFLSQPVDNHWAEIGLKSVEGNSIEHLVRFAYYFVIFSKEWINPDRVEAVLAALGLKLNKYGLRGCA
jgi:hypothetical protein